MQIQFNSLLNQFHLYQIQSITLQVSIQYMIKHLLYQILVMMTIPCCMFIHVTAGNNYFTFMLYVKSLFEYYSYSIFCIHYVKKLLHQI